MIIVKDEQQARCLRSRIIQEIENGTPDAAADRAGTWLAGIRSALDSMHKRAA